MPAPGARSATWISVAAAERDEDDIALAWYDSLLKGASNDFSKAKPVQIFVMGVNQWREEDDWPLARAKEAIFSSLRGQGEFR